MAFGTLHHSQDSDETNQDLAEINIIPLVDVMLVLLIIFMVAAPLSISGIKVQLPKSRASGIKVEEKKLILSIDRSGHYFVDKVRVNAGDLEAKLQAIFKIREKKEIYIRADKEVAYGHVIDAMSHAKKAGIHRMAMLTVPPTTDK